MGVNYDLGDKSENLQRMNHFEKLNKAKFCFAENTRFFEYYVRILALKIGDNLLWYMGRSVQECTVSN